MVLRALLALRFKAHLPASISLVWVTNPLTIAPFFYFCYKVGLFVLGEPIYPKLASLTITNIGVQVAHMWQPLFIGGLLVGSTVGLMGFWLVHLTWIAWVKYRWYRRRSTKP